MSKRHLASVLVYILFVLLFSYPQAYVAVILTLFVLTPLFFVVTIVHLKRFLSDKAANNDLLFWCLTFVLTAITLAGRFWLFKEYYLIIFSILLIIATFSLGYLASQLKGKSSLVIIILIVAIGFEIWTSNRFIVISDINRLDEISYEIERSNNMLYGGNMAYERIGYDSLQTSSSESVELMYDYLMHAIEATGGFKYPSTLSRVISPNQQVPIDITEQWITKINASLESDIEKRVDPKSKELLINAKGQFERDIANITVLELRLKVYSAINQLLVADLVG